MASASDYTTIAIGIARACSGDVVGAAVALPALISIAEASVNAARPPATSRTGTEPHMEAHFRRALLHLGRAQRAVDHGEYAELPQTLAAARDALFEAYSLIPKRDALRRAEISAQVAACEAIGGGEREAMHWMEEAYREALPIAVPLRCGFAERTRLEALLPELGQALIDAGSRIGLLGTRRYIRSWLRAGAPIESPSAGATIIRWKRQDAEIDLPTLTGFAGQLPPELQAAIDRLLASKADEPAAEFERPAEALPRRAVRPPAGAEPAAPTPPPQLPSPGPRLSMHDAIVTALHELRGPAGSAGQRAPAGFDMLAELHRHRLAEQAVSRSPTRQRALQAVISRRLAVLAAGAIPPVHRSVDDLLREI